MAIPHQKLENHGKSKKKKPLQKPWEFRLSTMGIPVDFPLKTIGKSWNLQIFPAKPIQKKHFAVQSRRLIRRFLAMLMQPVRLQLLESDGMMG